jgi:hypothetical protein
MQCEHNVEFLNVKPGGGTLKKPLDFESLIDNSVKDEQKKKLTHFNKTALCLISETRYQKLWNSSNHYFVRISTKMSFVKCLLLLKMERTFSAKI